MFKWLTLFMAFTLGGCTTLSPELKNSLSAEKSAVVLHLQDQKIYYNESTYAFVTIIESFSKSDFSSLWNPADELELEYIKQLTLIKPMNLLPASKSLPHDLKTNYVTAERSWFIENSPGSFPARKDMTRPPEDQKFRTPPTHAAYQELRSELRKQGVRYLHDVRLTSIAATKIAGIKLLQTPMVARIIDLEQNTVVWYGRDERGSANLGYGGDLKSIEREGFDEFKIALSKSTALGVMMFGRQLQ